MVDNRAHSIISTSVKCLLKWRFDDAVSLCQQSAMVEFFCWVRENSWGKVPLREDVSTQLSFQKDVAALDPLLMNNIVWWALGLLKFSWAGLEGGAIVCSNKIPLNSGLLLLVSLNPLSKETCFLILRSSQPEAFFKDREFDLLPLQGVIPLFLYCHSTNH